MPDHALPLSSLSDHLDWSALPARYGELRDAVGPEAALALIEAHGGNGCYIPRFPKPGQPVVRLLGQDTAMQLFRHFGAGRLDLPKPDAALRQVRRRLLQEERRRGATLDQLSRSFGLSIRRINQILSD